MPCRCPDPSGINVAGQREGHLWHSRPSWSSGLEHPVILQYSELSERHMTATIIPIARIRKPASVIGPPPSFVAGNRECPRRDQLVQTAEGAHLYRRCSRSKREHLRRVNEHLRSQGSKAIRHPSRLSVV